MSRSLLLAGMSVHLEAPPPVTEYLRPWLADLPATHGVRFRRAQVPKGRFAHSSLAVDIERNAATVEYTDENALEAARAALRLAAICWTLDSGGLALHAASARHAEGVVVFAGPAGSGKSTFARQLEPLDDDFVLLRKGENWFRPQMLDVNDPQRLLPGKPPDLPVLAVLLPDRDADGLERLEGARAVAGCLHVPPCWRDYGRLLGAAAALARSVPVARIGWRVPLAGALRELLR